MNNEGITSLAVVDNQFNVIGNISTADVKVGRCLGYLMQIFTVTAPDAVVVAPSATQHVHTFYFRHPINTRLNGREGLVPSVPCQSDVDACAYRGEGHGYQVAPVCGMIYMIQGS